jgi:ribosomal protein S18 acetylase RimI-like enzyme
METRKLTINDYEEIIKLWSRARLPYKPKGRDSEEAIAAQMKANPEFFLGAFEDNRLVGMVIISCDMRKGWINRLTVDPDYRNRGIATALIAESEKILRKHGIRIFCALIEDYNTASKKLFNECGYVEHRDIIYFSKRDSNEV